MTYPTYELSIDAGEPVLLYDFSVGSAHWRYTSADRPIPYLGNSFTPLAISSGSINQGNEIKKKTLAVTVPLDALVVQRLQNFPPSSDFLLTIITLHQTDPDIQGYTVFVGRVVGQSQAGTVISLNCEPAYTGVKTTGLRRRWQLNCAHVLYGIGCTLNPTDFRVVSAITAVAGPVVTLSGLSPPAGLSWPGGYLEWASGFGYLERRSINSASGTTLTLNYGAPDLVAGLAVNVYPGCDHSTAACIAFVPPGGTIGEGNILNYGGQPYIPSINPLAGNPIY